MTCTRRPPLALPLLLSTLLLCTAGCSHWFDRAVPARNRTLSLDGLEHPVQVSFDALGVPHIRARTFEDAVFAQGYVTAQDRLFFMDFHRRLSRGELAEILGKPLLPIDRFVRSVGMGRKAIEEARHLDAPTRALLEAYASGVNAYIASVKKPRHFGFSLLRYDPKPWTVEDTLVLCKGLQWVLDRMWQADIMRANLREAIGADRAADLLLEAGPTNRPIVGARPAGEETGPRVQAPAGPDVVAALVALGLTGRAGGPTGGPDGLTSRLLPALRTGSNNWVVSGARTDTGRPLLANDPHLQHFVISMIYLCHIRVEEEDLDVIGGSFPGAPGIIMGHNGSIAWGLTTGWADSDDLFIETFSPDDPSLYKVGDGWAPVETFTDRIAVRLGRDVDHRSEWTRHGPVIRRARGTGIALQWSGHDPPDNMMSSFLALNRATDWESFREALRPYRGGCFNTVYADVEGNIGYHLIGAVPVRASGDGSVPVPGAEGANEWTGTIPFDEMPHVLNPPSGWLATANNKTVGEDYPHLITTCWEASYRQGRAAELLTAKPTLTLEDFKAIQGDRLSHPGRFMREHLLSAASKVSPTDTGVTEAIERLRTWDATMTAESRAASIVHETLEVLLHKLLEPHLGEALFTEYRRSWPCLYHSVEMILAERPEQWLPGGMTGVEGAGSYDALLLDALAEALVNLEGRFGTDRQDDWHWGEIHALRFPWPLNAIFETGDPIPLGGDDFTLNVAHPTSSPDVQLLSRSLFGGTEGGSMFMPDPESLDVVGGPSLRMIIDFADLERSVYILDRGQSEHPGTPNHHDQLGMWQRMEYYPMMTDWKRIRAQESAHLELVPVGAAVKDLESE